MALRILYTSLQDPVDGLSIKDYHDYAREEALDHYREMIGTRLNITVDVTATIHTGTPDLPFYIVQVMLALSEK